MSKAQELYDHHVEAMARGGWDHSLDIGVEEFAEQAAMELVNLQARLERVEAERDAALERVKAAEEAGAGGCAGGELAQVACQRDESRGRVRELEILLAKATARADMSADARYAELELATNNANREKARITEALNAAAEAFGAKLAEVHAEWSCESQDWAAKLANAYPCLQGRIQRQRRELKRLNRKLSELTADRDAAKFRASETKA